MLGQLEPDRLLGRRDALPVGDDRLTTGAFLDRWLEGARSTIRPSTYISYAGHVRLHLAPSLGRIPLAKLSPLAVRDLVAAKLAAGLSARTVQYTHAVLRRALGQAVRDGLTARNVAALVDAPRIRRAEVVPFTLEEARAFLEAVRGDRLEALYIVAVVTGLRQGEVLGLRWSDIDWQTGQAGTLRVERSLQRVPKPLRGDDDGGRGTRYALSELKTDRSRRMIVMPELVARALRDHQARQRFEARWAGIRWQAAWDLIFTTTLGTPLDARNVTHRFQAICQQAGLPRLRFHDLRHSAATLMLAQGVDARTIMATLGHSQIGTTMNLYAHVLPALQQEAADRMDVALGGGA